jgi:hypothetical protein
MAKALICLFPKYLAGWFHIFRFVISQVSKSRPEAPNIGITSSS